MTCFYRLIYWCNCN